jgi:hypothetical protein
MSSSSLQFLLFGTTEATSPNADIGEEAKLPRRDWILLPSIGLLTICFIVISVGWVAHKNFSRADSGLRNCLTMNPTDGVRGIPNSECWAKNAEASLVSYKINSCGHRAGMECGPKPPGTYGIVMVGSSYPFGQDVPGEKTIAALLPPELAKQTGRRVELYNESMWSSYARAVDLRFDETLAAQPDMILWVLTKNDVERASTMMPDLIPPNAAGSTRSKIQYRLKQMLAMQSISEQAGFVLKYAKDLFRVSETGAMLMHDLYQSRTLYLKAALRKHSDLLWYLEAEPSETSRSFLQEFDGYASEIAGKAKAAGVPLVVVLVPDRVQAAMISAGEWPSDYNPYRLDEELRVMMESHGVTYIDIFPGFRNVPNSEQYYFAVDGHPDERWQPIISGLLAQELTSGVIPALKAPAQERAALEGTK